MRLARVRRDGAVLPALVDGDEQLRDLSSAVDDIAGEVLLPESLARLAGLDPAALPLLPPDAPLAEPVGRIGKIVGVGLNYRAHAEECGLPLPKEPTLFLKPTSALAGPIGPVEMPRGGTRLDWEVELAVVIGRPGRYIPVEDAGAHVAGYCLGIDFSERDFQFDRGGQGFKGKSLDGFAPLGPYLVTPDAVGDPGDLTLSLAVNGVPRQSGTTADMIFPVADLVATISTFMSLQSGDVIFTGTPAGVGMGLKPPVWLAVGDVVTADCPVLGRQHHAVAPPG